MNRRSFLAGILAVGAGPAVVRASSLMPIVVPKVWVPPWVAHGKVDRDIYMVNGDALRLTNHYLKETVEFSILSTFAMSGHAAGSEIIAAMKQGKVIPRRIS